ncbi:hypothetical protein NUW54_g7687 [Trametes sanguinea]|uniref:Uncharacterized protein n=1 Tax=Trametes sanguinea TaxID=158606 RepID=A0ACC1PIS0_9APHY|nr:hypothetical protein NUW54_g7687 [Trametes sanguinea]
MRPRHIHGPKCIRDTARPSIPTARGSKPPNPTPPPLLRPHPLLLILFPLSERDGALRRGSPKHLHLCPTSPRLYRKATDNPQPQQLP